MIRNLRLEQQGVLRSWNDTQGFGFIRAGSQDYFIHISSVQGAERPQQGAQVIFIAGTDKHGRLRAESMRQLKTNAQHRTAASQPHNSRQHRQRSLTTNNLKRTLSLLAITCAIPAVGTWRVWSDNAVLWPLVLYLGMSLLAFVLYWRDKHSAKNAKWRIPEQQLHIVELLGGWPGALLGQQLLRHKTQKASFQVVFWLIVLAHQLYWLDQLGVGGQLVQQVLNKF